MMQIKLAIYNEEWYKENNIMNILDKNIIKINTDEKIVTLEGDMKLKYDKCIYALGSESFIPPIPGHEKEGVIAIRRISDTNKYKSMLPNVKNAVVIGGGVLGFEAAWEFVKLNVM